MATSTVPDRPSAAATGIAGPKQQFADVFAKENATTRRVLDALPEASSDFRPDARSRSARELAWVFSLGQFGIAAALSNQWQWPPTFPPVPDSYADVLAAFDASTRAVQQAIANTPESRFFESVPFFTAPKTMGAVPVIEIAWFMLMDAVHHRGQLSVYLRMTGCKVPSIYGPSGDEPWI